ncbi:MAG: hypothetical protein AAGJ82_05065 [Bacteroidota bacterium]
MKQVFNDGAWLLLALLLSTSLYADDGNIREFSKTLNKQFSIPADGLVNLSNKYGKIDIKTWEQNAARISVKILVNASTESEAQEVFDRIDISFFGTDNQAGAKTTIEAKNKSWWEWGNDSDDFSINYEVFLPASANLDVTAKYCDVYSAATTGTGSFVVKYGNIKLDGLGEDSNVDLAYGNGNIVRTRDLDLELAYGNLDVGEASDLDLNVRYGNFSVDRAGDIICNSRYSTFRMGEIREFRNDGKYDNIEVDFAEEVVCETHYTNVKIDRLTRRLSLDMAYGSAKASQVDASFDEINVNGRYTDFKVYMPRSANCTLDLSGTYADIRLPSSGVNKSLDSKEGNSHEVRGHMGNGTDGSVKARLSYGGIVLGTN